jgi:hypothetical protein
MNGLRALVPLTLGLRNRTRRLHGRRGITPIKSKRKRILKTRCSKPSTKVENGISIQQHTSPRSSEERSFCDEKEHSEHKQWKGDKISGDHGKREDEKECQEVEQCGNQEDSTESVHPGSLPELSQLSEDAVTLNTNETGLQEER